MAQDKALAAIATDRCALPRNPVDSIALRIRAMESWERSNPQWPSVRRVTPQSRCQPDATGEEDARRSQGLG